MTLARLFSCALMLFPLAGVGAISGHLLYRAVVNDGCLTRNALQAPALSPLIEPEGHGRSPADAPAFDPEKMSLSATRRKPAATPEEIRSLVVRVFPEAEPVTVDTWTESFAGMDSDTIEMLLEQRRSLGPLATLRTPDPEWPSPSRTVAPTTPTAVNVTPVSHSELAEVPVTSPHDPMEWCRSNLKSLNEPGYHRALALRNSVCRTFEPARSAITGHPMHISLPEKETHLFFELDNGQLTRRGDFCLLTNGMVGLITEAGELPLRESPVVDPATGTVRIHSDGEIVLQTCSTSATDGMPHSCDVQAIGRVPVVAISDLSLLRSDDGVFFTSSEPPCRVAPTTIALRPGCVELSNVDAGSEIQQLNALETIRAR